MIYVLSKGGFGNQVFQLSYANHIKNTINDQPIFLNSWLLFLFDFSYKRKFELSRYISSVRYSFVLDIFMLSVFFIMKVLKINSVFNLVTIVTDDNAKNVDLSFYKLIIVNGYFIESDYISHSFFYELYAGLLSFRKVSKNNFLNEISYVRFFEEVSDSNEKICRNRYLSDLCNYSRDNSVNCFSSSHLKLVECDLIPIPEFDFSDLFVYAVNSKRINISDSSLFLVVGVIAHSLNNVEVHYFGEIQSFCEYFNFEN